MTDFKTKTSEVLAQGKAERGNFEPTGAPLRLYNYWLTRSNSKKAKAIRYGERRENFCHFWRVVAIWAPLFWLGRKIDDFLLTKTFGFIVLGFLVLAAAVLALSVPSFAEFLAILGAVVGIAIVAIAIGIGVAFLYQKFWNHRWDDTAKNVGIGALLLGFVGLMGFVLISAVMEIGFIFLAYLAAGIAAAALAIFGLRTLSDFISGRRERQAAERMNWTDEQWDEYYRKKNASRTPSKFEQKIVAFFSGLADFLILAFQIVRVKKWKICPMVDVKVN